MFIFFGFFPIKPLTTETFIKVTFLTWHFETEKKISAKRMSVKCHQSVLSSSLCFPVGYPNFTV